MEIFKNICVALVIIQAFCLVALLIILAIDDHLAGKAKGRDPERIGRHAFCALTAKPCIYADRSGSTCQDCPEAQAHYYTEEKNGDKIRGIQDEGRAD